MNKLNKINEEELNEKENSSNKFLLDKYYIVRTYSAGVFFGKLIEKENDEVILSECRRLYRWQTINNGISLSEVANHGLTDNSKVCEETSFHWVKAIELILCKQEAINSIKSKKIYVA